MTLTPKQREVLDLAIDLLERRLTFAGQAVTIAVDRLGPGYTSAGKAILDIETASQGELGAISIDDRIARLRRLRGDPP
jgi:hypothetical protein